MTINRQINVTYTADNLKQLLIKVINKTNLFTHAELADWCLDYTEKLRGIDLNAQIEKNAFSVAEDIDCQWELYLVNSFTLEQLQVLDKAKINLPENWFTDWLSKIVEDKNQLN